MIVPSSIALEASSFCQLRCPSCPTTTGAINAAIGRGFLTLENFRTLIDANPTLRRIELSNYGEIFLNPALLEILEYAFRAGVAIVMDNSVNLNDVRDSALEGLVKFGVERLTCSIDGASAETYRQYRVRGDFDRVIANIERINHFKRIYASERPHLTWQFIVFGHNEHELPKARQMAESLGMAFSPKLSWDTAFSPVRDADFVVKETGFKAASRAEHDRITGEKFMNGLCHQLWDKPQINWDGKVLGCCRNFWGDFGGNALTDGLTASINSEKMNHARAMLQGEIAPRDDVPCASCEIYHFMRDNAQWLKRPEAG